MSGEIVPAYGAGIALLPRSAPLPASYYCDDGYSLSLQCDLCGHLVGELWPLTCQPSDDQDDVPDGEWMICRACADGVRP